MCCKLQIPKIITIKIKYYEILKFSTKYLQSAFMLRHIRFIHSSLSFHRMVFVDSAKNDSSVCIGVEKIQLINNSYILHEICVRT